MLKALAAVLLLTLVVLVANVEPSHAGTANRAWVSGHGVDAAGCGAPTAPCRSLQYVHDNVVVAGGEIDILDPGGYGAISITKAISIVNDGVGAPRVPAPRRAPPPHHRRAPASSSATAAA